VAPGLAWVRHRQRGLRIVINGFIPRGVIQGIAEPRFLESEALWSQTSTVMAAHRTRFCWSRHYNEEDNQVIVARRASDAATRVRSKEIRRDQTDASDVLLDLVKTGQVVHILRTPVTESAGEPV